MQWPKYKYHDSFHETLREIQSLFAKGPSNLYATPGLEGVERSWVVINVIDLEVVAVKGDNDLQCGE